MAELIVALDVGSRREAVEAVERIGDAVGFYKIGLELFTAEGVGHGFFNRAPWRDRTTHRMDEFLTSLGYLEPPGSTSPGSR